MTDPDPSGQGVVGPRGGLEKYKDTPNLRVIGEQGQSDLKSEMFSVNSRAMNVSGQGRQV